ncbi:hypothetical protein F4778DRAFT_773608 [Xylariomycetidae sp. FL2044]|nr:hypothetical protein F4778DRAFT_773608 [Xylariomycetidae sp. FL2044]
MATPALPSTLRLKPPGGGTRGRGRGRGLMAAQSFKPGDLIATFSTPSIAITDTPSLPTTCSYCLLSPSPSPSSPASATSTTTTLRRCTACKTVRYCSPQCQKRDWTLAHRRECAAYQRVRGSSSSREADHDDGEGPALPTPVRALLQMLLRPEMRDACAALEGHVAAFRDRRGTGGGMWADFEIQARAAVHYSGMGTGGGRQGGEEEEEKEVWRAVEGLCKLQVNSFNRLDPDAGQTGLFLNPALAMVNHSCMPNAFVHFVGRKAVLRAYQAIEEGEEIEISYIEKNLHRSHRQKALRMQYHFECVCPRCKDDLDVYQVCQGYPHLELNSLSLVPDVGRLRSPPVQQALNTMPTLQRYIEEIYTTCSLPLQQFDFTQKSKEIRRRWNVCQQLRNAGLYAIEPLTHVLAEASVYFVEHDEYAYSLAITCFLALHSDPYLSPMPFEAMRVKSMLMIARLLTNTAGPEAAASGGPSNKRNLKAKISKTLREMDQPTIFQTVLRMVVHHGPYAHSTEWQVYQEAKELLDDFENRPGREAEQRVIGAFLRNPNGSVEREFFETVVLNPIKGLSDLAIEVMATEFGP